MIRKPSSLWLSLLLLNETPLATGTAMAQDGMPAPATRAVSGAGEELQPGITLYLAVTTNGVDRGLQPFNMATGVLSTSADTLRQIGLLPPDGAGDSVRLDSLAGLAIGYDERAQTLSLTAPLDLLDTATQIIVSRRASPPATPATGMLLDYTAYANFSGSGSSVTGFTTARAFHDNMVLENTAVISPTGGARGSPVTRLDSAWSLSLPERMLTLRVGDLTTAATAWSRSMRIGGVQFGTNFALQPYRVIVPVPTFAGSAVLPSKVDLYVNGMKNWSGTVSPGPFSVSQSGVFASGTGAAQLVLTDMLGQITTLDFALYSSPRLLAEGLADWSVELGAARRGYAVSSFGYDDSPVVSGTARRGMTDRLTLEAHAEASQSVMAAGSGAVWQLGTWGGVVSASLAGSRSDRGTGFQTGFGYEWSGRGLSIAAQTLRSGRAYADIAASDAFAPARVQDAAQLSYSVPVIGTVGMNYVRQTYDERPTFRAVSLRWNTILARRMSLSLSGTQNLAERQDRRFLLTLNISPSRMTNAGIGVDAGPGGTSETFSFERNAPTAGGLGVRIDGRRSDSLAGAARISWLGAAGQGQAGISGGSGAVNGFLGYSGSLALMDGHLFSARSINGGFAVVSTNGFADVPIRLENRPMGRTGRNGLLLVPGLNAYQYNRLAINPANLPPAARVARVEQLAVPADRAGVLVRFPITLSSAAVMTLVDGTGAVVPAGAVVQISGRDEEPQVVGFDGQFYIESALPGDVLSIDLPDGSSCRVTLPASLTAGEIARLGTVPCLPEGTP